MSEVSISPPPVDVKPSFSSADKLVAPSPSLPKVPKVSATPSSPNLEKPASTPNTPSLPESPNRAPSTQPELAPNLASSNLYEQLGIPKNATPDQVRSAYRDLAKKYHTDVNPNGQEQFLIVQHAYDVLFNPDSRSAYDANTNTSIIAAENMANIIYHHFPQQNEALIQASFEQVAGKPYNSLTPEQQIQALPAAIPTLAENLYTQVSHPEIGTPPFVAVFTGGEAEVIRVLASVGSKEEAQLVMFEYLLAALILILATYGRAAGGDFSGAQGKFNEAAESAQIAGRLREALKSGQIPASIQSLLTDLTDSSPTPHPASENSPPGAEKPPTKPQPRETLPPPSAQPELTNPDSKPQLPPSAETVPANPQLPASTEASTQPASSPTPLLHG